MKFNTVLPDLVAANNEGIKVGVDVLVASSDEEQQAYSVR